MKTVSFSNTARLLPVILFILVFATGCKKEENAFPLGDIKFSLSTTDSNGVEKNTFNYGEDINFVLSEILIHMLYQVGYGMMKNIILMLKILMNIKNF